MSRTQHDLPSQSLDSSTDGRHPLRGRPSNPRRPQERVRLKKSIYYGILLYILDEFRILLHPDQVRWIIYYSRRLSDAELQKAGRFFTKLKSEEVVLRRTSNDIGRIFKAIPLMRKTVSPEPRRIGTGYHDKGALRPRHRPRLPGDETWWNQDLEWLLPQKVEEGKWITAEEVESQISTDFLEIIRNNILLNTQVSYLSIYSLK